MQVRNRIVQCFLASLLAALVAGISESAAVIKRGPAHAVTNGLADTAQRVRASLSKRDYPSPYPWRCPVTAIPACSSAMDCLRPWPHPPQRCRPFLHAMTLLPLPCRTGADLLRSDRPRGLTTALGLVQGSEFCTGL